MNNATHNATDAASATDAKYNSTQREVITIAAATRGAHVQDEPEAPMSVEEQNRAQRALDELAIAALVLQPGTQQRNRCYFSSFGENRNALGMPTQRRYSCPRFIASRVQLVQQQHELEYIAMCYNPSILFCISEYAHRIELAARRIARLKWTPLQLLQGTQEFLVAHNRAVTLQRHHYYVAGSVDSSVFYYTAELNAEVYAASIVEMPPHPKYYKPL